MNTASLFKWMGAVMSAALMLAACAKEAPEVQAPSKPAGPYTFTIGGSTRTLLQQDDKGRFAAWESGDRIGTLLSSAGSMIPGYAYVNAGSPASFSLYHEGGFEPGDVVRAYYPYSSATTGLDNVHFSIPVSQSQNGTVFDFDAMPLVSEPYEITQSVTDNYNPVGEIYFANLAAVAQFRIFSSNGSWAGETVASVKFESSDPMAGEFSMDISGVEHGNPETLAISGYSATSIVTAVSSGPAVPSSLDNAVDVYMVLAPGTYGGTVTITTDKATYRFQLKSTQTFKRSVIRALGVDLGSCTDRSTTAVPITVSKTVKQILTGMGMSSISNGTKVEIFKLDDVISIETNGYNNCGKVYGTANQWRIYAADRGNIKIKAAPGYELQSVTLTYVLNKSGDTSPSFDGPGNNSAAAVSGCSVTYHVGNNLGNVQFTKFSVTYVESSYTPSRAHLDCYEIPAVDITVTCRGNETFDDEEGTGKWIGFDLPDDDRRVVTHTFYYNGRLIRNYTSMMDKNKRNALWVAYPMHGVAYSNNDTGRTVKFDEKKSYDPAIPASWQSSGSTKNGSESSPYSRGHLCASEDRQVTYASNCQTFYYSNQNPQWQNSFNSGVWRSLEGAVQSKAATLTGRDTLYVVSGTLYEDGNYGDSNDGGTVARPSHFYKLLMLCSFNSSGSMTSAKGAAYLYENVAHTGKKYNADEYKTTIDEIETRTGFNFFAAVPASLQSTAESAFSSILLTN